MRNEDSRTAQARGSGSLKQPGSAATYELWKHMADTHKLCLLESEVWDIVFYVKKLLTGMPTTERKTFCAVCGGKIHKRMRRGETIWTHTVPKGQRKMPRWKTPTPLNAESSHAVPVTPRLG